MYDPNEAYSPLARIDHLADAKSGDIFWFSTDLNGAPLDITDKKGQLCWSGQYRSFGEVHWQSEGYYKRAQSTSFAHQPLRYAGQYADNETGLHYNLFRYYDPQVGRFTVQDPIGLMGGINPYQYAPNALAWVDPLGLSCSTDARELRNNMVAEGRISPSYKNSAHHIVMSNSKDPQMIALREKMDSLGININSSFNGVYLPTSTEIKNSVGTDAISHSKIHTKIYRSNIFNRLKDIDNKYGFENELGNISEEILMGVFEY